MRKGVDGLASRTATGRPPIKAMAALSVVDEILSAPVADRPNWTLPRVSPEIERRPGVTISSRGFRSCYFRISTWFFCVVGCSSVATPHPPPTFWIPDPTCVDVVFRRTRVTSPRVPPPWAVTEPWSVSPTGRVIWRSPTPKSASPKLPGPAVKSVSPKLRRTETGST